MRRLIRVRAVGAERARVIARRVRGRRRDERVRQRISRRSARVVPPREQKRRREPRGVADTRRAAARRRPVVSGRRSAFVGLSAFAFGRLGDGDGERRQVAGELLGVPRAGARLEHIFGEAHHRCARGARRRRAGEGGRSPERAPSRGSRGAVEGQRVRRRGTAARRDAEKPRDSLGDGRHRRRVFSRRRRRDGVSGVSRRREKRAPRDAARGDARHPERDAIERLIERLEHAKRERCRFFLGLG